MTTLTMTPETTTKKAAENRVTVYMEESLKDRLYKYAKSNGQSISSINQVALRKYLDAAEKREITIELDD